MEVHDGDKGTPWREGHLEGAEEHRQAAHGEQLSLDLERSVYMPWGGRSPRSLTKAYKRFTFHVRHGPVDPFAAVDKAPPKGDPHGS